MHKFFIFNYLYALQIRVMVRVRYVKVPYGGPGGLPPGVRVRLQSGKIR